MNTSAEKDETAILEPPEQGLGNKPGVLVADDEHLVRIMVQMALERDGFEVWSAANGQEAIDLYREHSENIAVVLLDVKMPGVDGPEALEVLREMNPDVLACFMSGDTGEYEPDDLLRRGAARVIAKPFRLDHLVNVLWSVANGVPAEPLPSVVCQGVKLVRLILDAFWMATCLAAGVFTAPQELFVYLLLIGTETHPCKRTQRFG